MFDTKIFDLTIENVEIIENNVTNKRKEISDLEKETPATLWVKDLDNFLVQWEKYLQLSEKEESKENNDRE